ncbi:hypothetical protein BS78_07G228500 [Paspalum vaginatum]|nr:hypothetical protein BS78_07G228500 [Paspalum vaginatum]
MEQIGEGMTCCSIWRDHFFSSFLQREWDCDWIGCSILDLPASIGELVDLMYLNAPKIKSKMLSDFLTKLSELIYLNISGSDISALPDSIGEIKGVMHHEISGCKSMCKLPESFVNLKNLVHLDSSHLWRLKITAKALDGLTNISSI